jgi:hypothetical protein
MGCAQFDGYVLASFLRSVWVVGYHLTTPVGSSRPYIPVKPHALTHSLTHSTYLSPRLNALNPLPIASRSSRRLIEAPLSMDPYSSAEQVSCEQNDRKTLHTNRIVPKAGVLVSRGIQEPSPHTKDLLVRAPAVCVLRARVVAAVPGDGALVVE